MNSRLDYLRPYTPIIVNIQGEVCFSHISKKYEGEELAAANKRAQEHGGRPSSKPYCILTLDNPRILNPETLPADVVMIMQERFKPAKGTNVIKYYATSKSPNLPPVAYSACAGAGLAGQGIADRTHPLKHELDKGLTVTVGARIFDTAAGVGVGIDYVLIDEPIRYYESNSLAEALASQGVPYVAPDADNTQSTRAPEPVTNTEVMASNAYSAGGYNPAFPNSAQAGGEMPYDPALYYEHNTTSDAATMQNMEFQNGSGTRPQPQGNRNVAGQSGHGVAPQPQGNRNTAGQSGYGAAPQPQGNRNTAAQMGQARPMVRMGNPGQARQMAG